MYVIPFVSGLTTVTFLGISGILWYNFLKAWKGDPGTVIATPDVQMKTIVQLAEKGAEKGIKIGKIGYLDKQGKSRGSKSLLKIGGNHYRQMREASPYKY